MTTGSGLYLNLTEKDPIKQNAVIKQLIEGRSNAVGIFTITAGALSTTVSAPACGPNSVVLLFPTTPHAASALGVIYVQPADVKAGQFTVQHPSSVQLDRTYFWACLG